MKVSYAWVVVLSVGWSCAAAGAEPRSPARFPPAVAETSQPVLSRPLARLERPTPVRPVVAISEAVGLENSTVVRQALGTELLRGSKSDVKTQNPRKFPFEDAKLANSEVSKTASDIPEVSSESSRTVTGTGFASDRPQVVETLNQPLPVYGPPLVQDNDLGQEIIAETPAIVAGSGFYGSAEYLLWSLKGDTLPVLVTSGSPTDQIPGAVGQPGTSILFGGSDVADRWHSGGRFTLGYWLDGCKPLALEGSFFWLGPRGASFAAASSAQGSPVLARPFLSLNPRQGFPTPPYRDAEQVTFPGLATGSIQVATQTRLGGAEANLLCNLCCDCGYRLDLLAGLRYLELNENLIVTEGPITLLGISQGEAMVGDLVVVQDRFATRNQFYGGQLGAAARYFWDRWYVDVRGKLALGLNHQTITISGNQLILRQGGTGSVLSFPQGGLLALPSNSGRFSRDRFAVVPEIGLNVGYLLTDNLRIFVGYSFLYWPNVVRPGQQVDLVVDRSQIPNQPVRVVATSLRRPAVLFRESDFWAHGVNLGLELRF